MNQTNYIERPGCITAYAVLSALSAAGIIIGALVVTTDSIALGLFFLLFAIIPIATAIGLWQMRKWAWWIVVISQSLGVLSALFSILSSLAGGAIENIVSGIVSGLISGFILYWFVSNRTLFDTNSVSFDASGNPIKSSDNSATVAIIIGVLAVACLIPVAIIVILTLLGPQIGNVFSRITADLGTMFPH